MSGILIEWPAGRRVVPRVAIAATIERMIDLLDGRDAGSADLEPDEEDDDDDAECEADFEPEVEEDDGDAEIAAWSSGTL